jgi:hypothetical protein
LAEALRPRKRRSDAHAVLRSRFPVGCAREDGGDNVGSQLLWMWPAGLCPARCQSSRSCYRFTASDELLQHGVTLQVSGYRPAPLLRTNVT